MFSVGASVGILIIRLVVGLTFAGHGSQKLFGWFGGPGLKGTKGMMEALDVKPAGLMAFLAALGEFIAGLLMALGLWLWVVAALFVITMLVAIIKVHGKNGYWVTKNGIEYNVILMAIAVGLALIGPGQFAL